MWRKPTVKPQRDELIIALWEGGWHSGPMEFKPPKVSCFRRFVDKVKLAVGELLF